jgi:hypothetical protein
MMFLFYAFRLKVVSMSQSNATSEEEEQLWHVGRSSSHFIDVVRIIYQHNCFVWEVLQGKLNKYTWNMNNESPRMTDRTSQIPSLIVYVTSLKFLPENHPDGIKLNFSTLPRFETTVNEIRKEHEKNRYVISNPH